MRTKAISNDLLYFKKKKKRNTNSFYSIKMSEQTLKLSDIEVN